MPIIFLALRRIIIYYFKYKLSYYKYIYIYVQGFSEMGRRRTSSSVTLWHMRTSDSSVNHMKLSRPMSGHVPRTTSRPVSLRPLQSENRFVQAGANRQAASSQRSQRMQCARGMVRALCSNTRSGRMAKCKWIASAHACAIVAARLTQSTCAW